MSKDKFLNSVSSKTNVSKADILKLANDIQNKDLKDENNIRDIIQKVATLTDKKIDKNKEEQIIKLVKDENYKNTFNNLF